AIALLVLFRWAFTAPYGRCSLPRAPWPSVESFHFVHLSTPGRPNPNSLREFLVPLTSVALITSKDSGY
ncbi:MAG TPA: hypothetical protein VKP30_09690, partial [Polyangiaceae bacterium]|nr:hypothetical protein [Polyangiaceae bacterium]